MCYDLTNILTSMIGCSATFVAIVGGLIANKAISDSAEKEAIDKKIKQFDAELSLNNEYIESIEMWMKEDDAKDFIKNNLEELLRGEKLEEVYDVDDDNRLSFDELLYYWEQARELTRRYREIILSGECGLKNNDNVPKSIVEELTDFQYSICSKYGKIIESYEKGGRIPIYAEMSVKSVVERYNKAFEEREEIKKDDELILAKKAVLLEQKNSLDVENSMKKGIYLFVIVTIFNIIMPTIFMLFNPTTDKCWYWTETIITFATFSIGIILMVLYICSLFPKKEKNVQE